jgi:hypothetical protein
VQPVRRPRKHRRLDKRTYPQRRALRTNPHRSGSAADPRAVGRIAAQARQRRTGHDAEKVDSTELARVALGDVVARSGRGCAPAIALTVDSGSTGAPRAVVARGTARGAGAVGQTGLGRLSTADRRRRRPAAGRAAATAHSTPAAATRRAEARAIPITFAASHTRTRRAGSHRRIGAGTTTTGGTRRRAALRWRGTDRTAPATGAVGARFARGAKVAVVARGAIRLGRMGAQARRRVARAGIVALIGRTGDRIAAYTNPTLTDIGAGTGIAVVTGRAGGDGLAQPGGAVAGLALGTGDGRRARGGLAGRSVTEAGAAGGGRRFCAGPAVGLTPTDLLAGRLGDEAALTAPVTPELPALLPAALLAGTRLAGGDAGFRLRAVAMLRSLVVALPGRDVAVLRFRVMLMALALGSRLRDLAVAEEHPRQRHAAQQPEQTAA